MNAKTLVVLLVIVIAPITGFIVAPNDMPQGNYEAELSVRINSELVTETFNFSVTDNTYYGDPQIISRTNEVSGKNYTIIIESKKSYPVAYGSKLSFYIEIIDESTDDPYQPTLENIWIEISGLDDIKFDQRLQSTGRVHGEYEFSMRITFMSKLVMALLFLVAVLWFTEIISLEATSLLIPIFIVVVGITNHTEALKSFFDPVIALFLGGFLIARAMRKHKVDKYIALKMVSISSIDPKYLMLSMMGLSAFLSLWMSNTASTAVLVPIAVSIVERLGDDVGSRFKKALVLGIAYAASIGGIGSVIGTPANPMAVGFLANYASRDISFVEWFMFGIPFVIPMIIITWLYLIFFFKPGDIPQDKMRETKQSVEDELKKLGNLSKEQKMVFGVFGFTVFLWLFSDIIVDGFVLFNIRLIPKLFSLINLSGGLTSAIIALTGALLLFIFRLLESDDVARINWSALLIFGGGLTLGNMIVNTGVSDWMALQLGNILPATGTLGDILLISVVIGVLALIITMFASNTASAAMLIPLAIPLAAVLNIDPTLLVVIVAIGSSVDFALVIGTPPTMIAYSTGYFNVREVFRAGIILDIIGIVLLTVGMIFIWALLGLIVI